MGDDSKDTETQASDEPPVDLWAVSYSDAEDRELTFAEVAGALQRGEIDGSTIVWRPGMADWQPLAQTPDFAPLLERGASAAAPATKPESQSPPPVLTDATDLEMLDADFRPRARYVKPAAGLLAAVVACLVFWSLAEGPSEGATTGSARPESELASANPNRSGATPSTSVPTTTLSDFEPESTKPILTEFNRFAVLKTMGAAAYKAIRCRGRGTPAGVAYVTVTFEPSGTISSARIYQAPYAGTPTATCILGKIRGTTIAPFKGSAVTLRIPVELH